MEGMVGTGKGGVKVKPGIQTIYDKLLAKHEARGFRQKWKSKQRDV